MIHRTPLCLARNRTAVYPRLAENRGILGAYLLRNIGRLRTILWPRTVSR